MSFGVWRATEDLVGVARAESLPERIAVGGGVALLVRGAYMVPGAPRWPTLDFGGEVVDLRAALAPTQRFNGRFWAIVDVPAGTSGAREVALDVPLDDGTRCRLPLGCLELDDGDDRESLRCGDRPSQVAICMATYDPEPDLFATQIQSLREQTCSDWRAVISDDASAPSSRAMITSVVDGDERFTVLWNDEKVGSYGNFERALSATPDDAGAIAFCDQDDRWYPEKLDAMLSLLPSGGLVACDARIIGPNGQVQSETFWTSRRHLPGDLRSISVANSVPGCMCLWDASLKTSVLPFPPATYTLHHDGWVAAVAAANGGICRIDRPLIDHVQHAANTLGHSAAVNRRIGRLGRRDLPRLAIPAHRRQIAARAIDAALRPEALARTIRLRRRHAGGLTSPGLDAVSRDDDGLDRVAEYLWRGLKAEFRRGLPGTEYAVARGLIAARVYRSWVTGSG
jgi:glycosyltransferase involved in cell wall biosynthesis